MSVSTQNYKWACHDVSRIFGVGKATFDHRKVRQCKKDQKCSDHRVHMFNRLTHLMYLYDQQLPCQILAGDSMP